VVQSNKSTSTGGDDQREIHYHKDEVQNAIQKAIAQTQKP
jgi:hypothetical protein